MSKGKEKQKKNVRAGRAIRKYIRGEIAKSGVRPPLREIRSIRKNARR